MVTLPRVVVAAPSSGAGKTTVATGLMAALRRAGHVVSGHKVGPDYIDPGYHALATGRAGRNLDPHLVGEDRLVPLLLHGAATPVPADVAVIEGVMGLYDGAIGRDGFASTAHVATVVRAPVVLVVDISAASRTVAAVVHGLATFDPQVRIAGVIMNKAGSERHAGEVTAALEHTGLPVLGVLYRDDGIAAPSRHLGLVPAAERGEARAALDRLAAQVADRVDLGAVLRIARGAPELPDTRWDATTELVAVRAGAGSPVVAVAGGRAFTFRYAETDELLRAAGCDPVVFDPTEDDALPTGTAGIYLGGGFPEVHAAALTANTALRRDLLAAMRAGIPTVAECAGLLYLCRSVDGNAMVGAVPSDAGMRPKLTLGYRTAVAPSDSVLAAAGYRVTGHEFHRTLLDDEAADQDSAAWLIGGRHEGFALDPAEAGLRSLHASYLHVHWAGHPALAARFAAAVQSAAGTEWRSPASPPRQGATQHPATQHPATQHPAMQHPAMQHPAMQHPANQHAMPPVAPPAEDLDLRHHGDREIADGLTDLAVNVRRSAPPAWLTAIIDATTGQLAAYPDPQPATAAVARRHGRHVDEVLLTAGAAEAFTLIARAVAVRHAVVVHPQFTEPEVSLRNASRPVHRLVLREDQGFRLDPAAVDERADLVMIGNPTNPTGILHRATDLGALLRPGRVVVVDEAFLDAVPSEPESLVEQRLPGLLVVRSLTKTWGLAGLRAGYVVGDRDLIGGLRAQQPPWSVSTPALAAIEACCAPAAVADARAAADAVVRDRRVLLDGLAEVGLTPIGPSRAPFVLVDTTPLLPAGSVPGTVREQLRQRGFAVRRGDTFPGLGADWIRIAVKDPLTTRRFLHAVAALAAASSTPSARIAVTPAARAAR